MSSIIAGFALQMWRSFPASPSALMPSVGPVLPRSFDGLSMSPPIIRVCHSASAPVLCAPSPASLGPCDANGEARAVYRHGTSPLAFPDRSAGNQPVFCRPAATPETVHRMR